MALAFASGPLYAALYQPICVVAVLCFLPRFGLCCGYSVRVSFVELAVG